MTNMTVRQLIHVLQSCEVNLDAKILVPDPTTHTLEPLSVIYSDLDPMELTFLPISMSRIALNIGSDDQVARVV